MTLAEMTAVLKNSDMLRIVKDGKTIYVGFLGLFKTNHENKVLNKIYERNKDTEVKQRRAEPEITHRKWKELNLTAPLLPDVLPDYKYKDLQEKLYYTIYL